VARTSFPLSRTPPVVILLRCAPWATVQRRELLVQGKLRLGPITPHLPHPSVDGGCRQALWRSLGGALGLAKNENGDLTERDSDSLKWFCLGRLCLRGRKSRHWMCRCKGCHTTSTSAAILSKSSTSTATSTIVLPLLSVPLLSSHGISYPKHPPTHYYHPSTANNHLFCQPPLPHPPRRCGSLRLIPRARGEKKGKKKKLARYVLCGSIDRRNVTYEILRYWPRQASSLFYSLFYSSLLSLIASFSRGGGINLDWEGFFLHYRQLYYQGHVVVVNRIYSDGLNHSYITPSSTITQADCR